MTSSHSVRANFLAQGPVRRVRWSPAFPLALQGAALVVFALLLVNGLGVREGHSADDLLTLRKTNLTTLVVWGLWWPAMVGVALGFGRVWCTVCPMELVNRAGDALARRLGLRRAQPGRLLRAGWAVLAAYLVLQVLVAGVSIHRAPYRTSLMLASMLGLALVTGFVYRHPRSFCSAAALLSVYGRFTRIQLDVVDRDVCASCRTQDCVRHENRHRFDARSCPSLVRPHSRALSDGCVLCFQCAKACPHANVGFGVVERLAVEGPGEVEEGGVLGCGLGHGGLLGRGARGDLARRGEDQAAWSAGCCWDSRSARACWAACLSIPASRRRFVGSCMSTRTSGSLSVATSSGLCPMEPSASASSGVTPRAARKARAASPSWWSACWASTVRVSSDRSEDRRCSASSASSARAVRMAAMSWSTWSRLCWSCRCIRPSMALLKPWSWPTEPSTICPRSGGPLGVVVAERPHPADSGAALDLLEGGRGDAKLDGLLAGLAHHGEHGRLEAGVVVLHREGGGLHRPQALGRVGAHPEAAQLVAAHVADGDVASRGQGRFVRAQDEEPDDPSGLSET